MANSAFDLIDLARCAQREVAQRQRVYPRLVAKGQLRQETAMAEIARMRAIADLLHQMAASEPTLFSEEDAAGG